MVSRISRRTRVLIVALAALALGAAGSAQQSPAAPPIRATVEVDLAAPGKPISPFIYGAAMGDRALAREMGLTILRAGGNEVTALNWKRGFAGKGNDWFFENFGEETPPEKNWLVAFHGENRKAGLETYLTIPIMGRVAKDGISVAFDTRRYPDQESWAGKVQAVERLPHAGNGRQYLRGPDAQIQRQANGQPLLRDVPANPDDTSVAMTPAEQAQMLAFMIRNMGYGTAAHGGVKYIALDNEPMLWNSTHRGMHPEGCSYDELWQRTETYGSLLKKIDPGVRLAGPCLWGWTAYFYSGRDTQLINSGKASWSAPPDFTAHGRVPLAKWYLQQLNAYRKRTGHPLVDIFDWHFYPQTAIALGAGKPDDPETMESRVQETRVLWDPSWKDPSWMGSETGKVIRLIPLMKQWIGECNPGMQTSLGEYNFGGEKDVSGGVAQAELLGIFAREGLDFAFFWFFPERNSPQYWAFRLFRNADGQRAAFGDRYLPARCSAPNDVSAHVARDSRRGMITVLLINKRSRQPAEVEVKFDRPLPAQQAAGYLYGGAAGPAILALPPRRVAGNRLALTLAPMSVTRLDLKN